MKRSSFIKKVSILTVFTSLSGSVVEKKEVKKVYLDKGRWEKNWLWDDERKRKLAERRKGSKHSEETKLKISNKLKGRKKSVDHIENWRRSYKGFKKSDQTKLKLSKSLKGIGSKPILQLDLNNNIVNEWPSITEAAKFINSSHENIASVARGKQKTAKGFIWKYKNP